MPLFEFCCFLHPHQKGTALHERCSVCDAPYDFPLLQRPTKINGKTVTKSLGRGFYGVVYEITNPRTGIRTAAKVVPNKVYEPLSQGGYGKSFDAEARLHAELSDAPMIAKLQDWGADILQFGDISIDCRWMEMEFVDGTPLADVIAQGPESPRQVAQIALDLLAFVELLKQRGRFHNDLHGENVLVTRLGDDHARRRALDPHLAIKVIDLGSAADRNKAGAERMGDVHWVATHIQELLDQYERVNPDREPGDVRLTAALRRVAEFYSGDMRHREPEPADMIGTIQNAYSFGARPGSQPVSLRSVGEHFNAQSLPAFFARDLLYDPSDQRWSRRLMSAGPLLMAGMRGCGKTMLFRSLEWTARLHRDDAATDQFVGVFVSCASLLRKPRSEVPDAPLQRLFLAFAREIVRDVHECELRGVGEVDYSAIAPFAETVRRIVPWVSPPASTVDIVALEQALSRAIQSTVPATETEGSAEFSTRVAFDELVASSRRLVDLWRNRTFLFLLDDVSTRYLPAQNVQDMLSQFCVPSPDWGFKISTETQTLVLTTPAGAYARRYRDYDFFDLGLEVFQRCSDDPTFIREILVRRLRRTEGLSDLLPEHVLGSQPLIDIARRIKDEPGDTPVYWGVQALTGMCVGDIGDVLQAFERIIERAASRGWPVPDTVQHAALIDLSESKLIELGVDQWLYSHAVAFAHASHLQLLASGERARQYTRLFVRIDHDSDQDVFDKLIKLIDAGIFVLTGGSTRTKSKESRAYSQFKLAYRNVLGLTGRIPLSKRDRFELGSDAVADWLRDPAPTRLRISASRHEEDAPPDDILSEPAGSDPAKQVDERVASFPVFAQQPLISFTNVPSLPLPHTLHVVDTLAQGDISEIDIPWSEARVVGAFGFEERSELSWIAIRAAGTPAAASLIAYPIAGRRAKITNNLDSSRIPWAAIDGNQLRDPDDVDAVLATFAEDVLVIDTTSLTKALIYLLISRALIRRSEVFVLHTSAAEYFPSDRTLADVVALIEDDEHAKVQALLNNMVAGESGPYATVTVGPNLRDPSHPSMMATFIALKHDRVGHLLEDTPVERIAAIEPTRPDGAGSNRAIVHRYLARYFVQRYGGETYACGSLDHHQAYQLLSDLHRDYALVQGFNFELGLTGTKLQTVGAAMLASTVTPAAVHYSSPRQFDSEQFTGGAGATRAIRLRRREG